MKEPFVVFALILSLLINVLAQEPQAQRPSSTQPPPSLQASPSPQVSPAALPTPPPMTVPTPDVQARDQEESDDVVRITTRLVQVDATVTDKAGKQVNDLTAADFEITENGHPQKITNFSYVSPVSENKRTAATPPSTADKEKGKVVTPPSPIRPLQPDQVHRAIALVVDDLRMSHEGISSTRQALRKYIDQQMQPGDLVAIIRTSAGIGSLQQFTNDRQQLNNAIEHIRQIARVGGRFGAFTSVNMLDRLETQFTESLPSDSEASADRRNREGAISAAAQSSLRGSGADRSEGINEFRDTLLTVGTLGALNFVVRGLTDLPGRKAVVLFSDGISIFNSDSSSGDRNARVLTALRQLVERANRASVVFYAIDTRGLQPTGFSASDNTTGGVAAPGGSGPAGAIAGIGSISSDLAGRQVFGNRSSEIFEGQNGLDYLAHETGGLAVFNNNDLNKGIRRALDDIGGYYLIGYRPDEATFDPVTGRRQYNTWDIKVRNHPDLKVRSRGGFIGVADDESRKSNRTRTEQLMAALLSPFSANGINLQLTSFFLNDATSGSTMRSLLLMDANKLTFKQLPNGQMEAMLDLIGVTLDDNGQILDQITRIAKINVSPDKLQRFREEGMVYGLNVPVAKPGAYLLRIAVRDDGSGRIGSAGQYIEVPNVNSKDHLVLSSLVISGNNPEGMSRRQWAAEALKSLNSRAPSTAPPSGPGAQPDLPLVVAGGEGMVGTEDPRAGPASRRFRSQMYLNFACLIYNNKKHTNYTSQLRLFHDGQEVYIGPPTPLDLSQQTDLKRLLVARRVFLGTILEPGDYILHLTVMDASGSGKPRTSTRWLDFRIVDQ